MKFARLLFPAIRWTDGSFDESRPTIEQGLELGVGGFIVFGGEADAVRELTRELHARSAHPLLVGSDLERGAGQQFRGATPLPPAAALGSLDDPETTRRAGELTAREARALGVNWIYAPVADVDLEPENPIIGTRAFGEDPERVAEQIGAWIRGCSAGGALSCAKHFPGHGRTRGDSHIERPSVSASRGALAEDLRPFHEAIRSGVDSIMTAHVSYPALDAGGVPATLSPPILQHLLRDELGFTGLTVTDALIMEGMIEDVGEADAGVQALAAGCDALLYPNDPLAVIEAVEAAVEQGSLAVARVEEALSRIAEAADRVQGEMMGEWGAEEDRRWALETARRTLRVLRGEPALSARAVKLVVIDDDVGGPFPPYPRHVLPAALHRAGIELTEDSSAASLIALFADIRAWKGRPGISPAARERVREATDGAPDAVLLLFSHPRLVEQLPTARHVLGAWGGEALMQEVAVGWLVGTPVEAAGQHGGLDR